MASSKDAVVLDIDGHEVRVSNPEKPYFGDRGIRKIDVVEYFVSVGPGILNALRDRPTTLERWPGGVFEGARISTRVDNTGDAFYQKRVPKNAPEWVPTAHITFPSGRTADEVAPDSVAVVAWAANLGTLTFHPWPVNKADVESPDQIPSTSTRSRAPTSPTPCGWPRTCANCWASSACRAGRRPPAGAGCTSTCRSSPDGHSSRCVGR